MEFNPLYIHAKCIGEDDMAKQVIIRIAKIQFIFLMTDFVECLIESLF